MKVGDCIVVFCHFLQTSGALSEEFRVRLNAAIVLWHWIPRRIIVSGGQTKGTPIAQAKAAREYLETVGRIPGWWITTSNEGHDTLNEVTFAVRTMRERMLKRPVIVSNRLHLAQARVAFWRHGISCLPHATPATALGAWYWFTRIAVLFPTILDPHGSNWLFRLLRWSREKR